MRRSGHAPWDTSKTALTLLCPLRPFGTFVHTSFHRIVSLFVVVVEIVYIN